MKQYIDKSKIVAEIERRKTQLQTRITELGNFESNTLGLFQEVDLYDDILSFLNTLEVKEEVLDRNDKTKLMRKCVKTAYKRGYDMGVLQTTNKINHNTKEVDLEKATRHYLLHEHTSPLNKIFHQIVFRAESQYNEDIEKAFKSGFEHGLKAQKGE